MHAENKFKPCIFLSNGHLQTWAGGLLPRNKLHTISEQLTLPNNHSLEIHSLETKDLNAPILFLIHGLEGSVESNYIQGMLQVAKRRSWRAVVMHFRKNYHAGLTEDVQFVLSHIATQYPNAKIMAVGYSLGANLLLKFLGENPKQAYLNTAVAVCAPFDLAFTTRKLNKGMAKIYDKRFVKSLNEKVGFQAKNLFEFDDQVTAPLHGFKNALDYYEKNSCKHFLRFIKAPTLIISAADDPVIPKEVIPQLSELSADITLDVQAHGGHVGFVSCKKFGKLNYWLEDRIPEWLDSYIK